MKFVFRKESRYRVSKKIKLLLADRVTVRAQRLMLIQDENKEIKQ